MNLTSNNADIKYVNRFSITVRPKSSKCNFLNMHLYFVFCVYYICIYIYRVSGQSLLKKALVSRAFQNTIIKYFFIEYFSSYEA